MKKTINLLFMFLLAASTSFAAVTIDPGEEVEGVDDADNAFSIGRLSSNVSLGWEGNTKSYALTTFHENGTTVFGTSHDTTVLYRLVDQDSITEPTASDSSEFDGWRRI